MKKLLATLLVAVMLMSCMAVVSFADGVTISTTATYPYEGLDAYTPGMWGPQFSDPAVTLIMTKDNTADLLTYLQSNNMSLNGYVPTKGSYVVMPFNVENVGTFSVNVTWDPAFLSYVGCSTDYNGQINETTKTDKWLNYNGFNSAGVDVTGRIGNLLFKVNNDAIGDADGNATTTISFENEKTQSAGEVNATITNDTISIALTGLEKGASSEPTITDITEDEAKAITPVVAGVFEATGMIADIQSVYSVDVTDTLASEWDAENMDYIPVFASFPTENKNAPSEYGIILHAADGSDAEDAKVKGVGAVNGMFGVVFYGFDGHLAKYDSASVYVVVNGVEYTSTIATSFAK